MYTFMDHGLVFYWNGRFRVLNSVYSNAIFSYLDNTRVIVLLFYTICIFGNIST